MINALDLRSQVFCIGVLVASVFVLSSIDEVEDYIDKRDNYQYYSHYDPRTGYYRYYRQRNDLEYEDARGYRGAAEWMICVASLSIIIHPAMLLFRYLCCRERVRSLFAAYSYVVCQLYHRYYRLRMHSL